jgi:hypothetical protein
MGRAPAATLALLYSTNLLGAQTSGFKNSFWEISE